MAFEYFLHLFIFFCIYGILAVSLNLLVGVSGVLNLGNAAFYGIGAYVSTLLLINMHVPWLIAMLLGGLVAAFFAILVGIPTLKLRGDYIAIATLGFGEIARAVFNNWTDVTNGPLGINAIPKPEILGISFDSIQAFAVLALVFLAITVFVINRIIKSPYGRVLRSIREDETASVSLGKNALRFKVEALAISSFFAGVAGCLYAGYVTYIDPSTFSLIESVLVVAMIVLGGLGSTKGALAGSLILVLLPEALRFVGFPDAIVGAMRLLIYALLLILLMIYRPEGIFGKFSFKKWKKEAGS